MLQDDNKLYLKDQSEGQVALVMSLFWAFLSGFYDNRNSFKLQMLKVAEEELKASGQYFIH